MNKTMTTTHAVLYMYIYVHGVLHICMYNRTYADLQISSSRTVQHCKTATNVDLRRFTCMLEEENREILYFTPSWLEYWASATQHIAHRTLA